MESLNKDALFLLDKIYGVQILGTMGCFKLTFFVGWIVRPVSRDMAKAKPGMYSIIHRQLYDQKCLFLGQKDEDTQVL